jgi:hypothetical protein
MLFKDQNMKRTCLIRSSIFQTSKKCIEIVFSLKFYLDKQLTRDAFIIEVFKLFS